MDIDKYSIDFLMVNLPFLFSNTLMRIPYTRSICISVDTEIKCNHQFGLKQHINCWELKVSTGTLYKTGDPYPSNTTCTLYKTGDPYPSNTTGTLYKTGDQCPSNTTGTLCNSLHCWSVTRWFISQRKVRSPEGDLTFEGRQTVGSHSNKGDNWYIISNIFASDTN